MWNFKVGKWTVEPETGRLLRPGIERVTLGPKVMGVLVALLEQPGRWWTQADLIQVVWAGQSVDDEVVRRFVGLLRRLLGSSKHPVIEELPHRGYRWVGPVQVLEGGLVAEAAPARSTELRPSSP